MKKNTIEIRLKADFSWWDALKIRLAGGGTVKKGEDIKEHLKKTVDNLATEKTSQILLKGHEEKCVAVAKAFGIKHCQSLQLNMHVDEDVTIKTEFYPEIDGVMQLDTIFRQYNLVEL